MTAAVLPARQSASYHQTVLVIATTIVALSVLLDVRSDQRVAFRFLPQFPLPETCASRVLLGIDCPGCGLTRSLVHLAHGRIAESYAMHHVGWLIAAAVLCQLPYRLLALRRGEDAPLGRRLPQYFAQLLIAVLLLNWLWNIVGTRL